MPDGSDYDVLLTAADVPSGDIAAALRVEGRATDRTAPECTTSCEKGLSQNVDNRVRWVGERDFPKRAIGAWVYKGDRDPRDYRSFCTGTLIGARVVLTAAHCVYEGNGDLIEGEFVAGKDGTYSAPYGYRPRGVVWRNKGWMDRGCYRNAVADNYCAALDYAVVVLGEYPEAPDGARPGHFGWKSHDESAQLSLLTVSSAGYSWPGPHAPRGSADDWLYRDDFCTIDPKGTYWQNAHGAFYFSCDASSGESGGPVWSTSIPGAIGENRLVGIKVTETCQGATCTGRSFDFPTQGAVISRALSELMSTVKANNP